MRVPADPTCSISTRAILFPAVGSPAVGDRKHATNWYGRGSEARAVQQELGGFDFESFPACGAITNNFGTNVRLREFKAIIFALMRHIKKRSWL